MAEKEKIIEQNLSMTGILKWLKENYIEKKTGEPFNLRDIQGYIKREILPPNYGGHKIKKMNNKFSKLYKLVE